MHLDPPIPANTYHDGFGNFCHVIRAPAGRLTMSADFLVQDNGAPDLIVPQAEQHARKICRWRSWSICSAAATARPIAYRIAWSLFGKVPKGWPLVKAICDYVHDRITFGYQHASSTKTALDAHTERRGVCRDFAHLAVALCRCMNIPARYCTGYLGDIGVPTDDAPMDFSAWFEAYLGGRWYTFDARHNMPRIGRILMARGRDATDVAIVTSFGPCTLAGFKVFTDEVTSAASASP